MRKFKGRIMTNIIGSEVDFEFEVDDDATEEEIEEEAKEAAFNYIDWGYEEVINTENPNEKCKNCLCSECVENVSNELKSSSCSGCLTCDGVIVSCPLGLFKDEYGDYYC